MRGALAVNQAGTSDLLKGILASTAPNERYLWRFFLPARSVDHELQVYSSAMSMTLRENGQKDVGEI